MRIGCSSKFSELEVVRSAGYDYIVLQGKEVASASEQEFYGVLHAMQHTGLPCVSLNAYCREDICVAGPNYERAKNKLYAQLLARRASALGVQTIGIGSPAARQIPDDFNAEIAWHQLLEFMDDTSEVFASQNILTGIEPLGYCFCNLVNRVQEASELVTELKGRIGITLDLYNMEKSFEADLDLTPYADQIIHAHISDDFGDCYQRSPLDRKRYPVHRKQIRHLLKCGYTGDLTLEVDVPAVQKDLTDSAAFLHSVCAEIEADSVRLSTEKVHEKGTK